MRGCCERRPRTATSLRIYQRIFGVLENCAVRWNGVDKPCEQDPEELMRLVNEINRLLDEKQHRLRAQQTQPKKP